MVSIRKVPGNFRKRESNRKVKGKRWGSNRKLIAKYYKNNVGGNVEILGKYYTSTRKVLEKYQGKYRESYKKFLGKNI